MSELYQVLGVEHGASQEDIKAAYRRRAKQLHPDRHPDDSAIEERFKQVSAAYAILSDPAMRKRYDRGEINASGQEQQQYQYQRDSGVGGGFEGFAGGFNVEDILGDLFGGAGGFRPGRRGGKGADEKYSIHISFAEAARGGKQRLTMAGGRSFDVAIPEGMTDGQTIRLKGQGQKGQTSAGDVLIQVEIEPHPKFTRDGEHVRMDLGITLGEAVLGAKIDVPTLDGTVAMHVPASANTGDTLRLRGKGISVSGGKRGDQLVRLKIMLPREPDTELTKLVEAWSRNHSYTVR